MDYDLLLVQISQWQREAISAILKRRAEQQLGELWKEGEDYAYDCNDNSGTA